MHGTPGIVQCTLHEQCTSLALPGLCTTVQSVIIDNWIGMHAVPKFARLPVGVCMES